MFRDNQLRKCYKQTYNFNILFSLDLCHGSKNAGVQFLIISYTHQEAVRMLKKLLVKVGISAETDCMEQNELFNVLDRLQYTLKSIYVSSFSAILLGVEDFK